jgi:hypothetical protein
VATGKQIHAGINGLEAGQSLVIALATLAHNLLQLGGPCESDRTSPALAPSNAFV